MERRGINVTIRATDERQQHADGEAKAMEQRQAVEKAVSVGDVRDREHLSDIRQEIGVSERDAFGDALRAAGEEDYGSL